MRLTEFWSRMDDALGPAYARSWASQFVMAEQAGNEVVASSPAAGHPTSQADDGTVLDSSTTDSQTQGNASSSSFQAINMQAAAENSSTAVNTAAPPLEDAAVSQAPSQPAETSEPSNAAKAPSQPDEGEK